MNHWHLWVARHAPVAAENRCYGRTDVPTLISHESAAAQLVNAYRAENGEKGPPQIVWTSPLSRCRAVAELLAAHWLAALHVSTSLYEMDFGAWDGRTWSEIEVGNPALYARWMREWQNMAPPGGEAPCDLEARVRNWLGALDSEKNHAVVAHAGVIRALLVIIRGCSWPDAMGLSVAHLSWTALAWPSRAP